MKKNVFGMILLSVLAATSSAIAADNAASCAISFNGEVEYRVLKIAGHWSEKAFAADNILFSNREVIVSLFSEANDNLIHVDVGTRRHESKKYDSAGSYQYQGDNLLELPAPGAGFASVAVPVQLESNEDTTEAKTVKVTCGVWIAPTPGSNGDDTGNDGEHNSSD